jgi:hypothetical protein
LVQDGVELAEALRTSLRKDKIVLLGHSWGSVLGVLMAKKKPDLFHAFVGTGQVSNPAGGYVPRPGSESLPREVAFNALIVKARAIRDTLALRELRELGPPPYKDWPGYQVLRRWSVHFEGADVFLASMLGFGLSAPGYTIRDVNDWSDGQGLSGDRLVPQQRELAPTALAGQFELPVLCHPRGRGLHDTH